MSEIIVNSVAEGYSVATVGNLAEFNGKAFVKEVLVATPGLFFWIPDRTGLPGNESLFQFALPHQHCLCLAQHL